MPEHEVLRAAVHADPTTFAEDEMVRRDMLGFPPATAMAAVSGVSAQAFVDALGSPLGVEVMGPADGRWLLRALDHATLCDALDATPRPGGRLRIEVDPQRI
jgi:primosomal protein N' (replication factor Y)